MEAAAHVKVYSEWPITLGFAVFVAFLMLLLILTSPGRRASRQIRKLNRELRRNAKGAPPPGE